MDLNDLEAKARAATAGRWRTHKKYPKSVHCGSVSKTVIIAACEHRLYRSEEMCQADAAYIAAANPAAVLELIERVRELEATHNAIRQRLHLVDGESYGELIGVLTEIENLLDTP